MTPHNNPCPRFEFDPQTGVFDFNFSEQVKLSGVVLRAIYRFNGIHHHRVLHHWRPATVDRNAVWEIPPDREGIAFRLQFGTRPDGLFTWKLMLFNQGSRPVIVKRLELLHLPAGRQVEFSSGERAAPVFFEHGWQSWSYSAAYGAGQRAPRTRMAALFPGMWAADGTPQPRRRGQFGSEFFGILADRTSRRGLVAGFLSQREEFGSVAASLNGQARLQMWANGSGVVIPPGSSLTTDQAVLGEVDLDQEDPLGVYIAAVAQENQARVPQNVPVGWCSWYHFYQKVSAADVQANLASAIAGRSDWPMDLIQIDDGFEAYVGEWDHFNSRFPDGLSGLAAEIRSSGLTPGIWLAPFLLQPQAEMARMHPDWMIKAATGKPRSAGFHWNSRTVALDLTNPEACEWVETTIQRTVKEWGFPYLKLDFLYAGGLAGQRMDPTRTNAQVLHMGLELIRRAAGEETFLLGCGCPIGSGVGIFDAMRISADTAPAWENYFFEKRVPFLAEPAAPAAENALQNILIRASIHRRWWWNDPDCLLLRPESHLTLPEIQTIATAISLTGGMLLVSDDLPALPAERSAILAQLIPVIGRRAELLDWLDQSQPSRLRLRLSGPTGDWTLVAWINRANEAVDWKFTPAEWGMSSEPMLTSSFWDSRASIIQPGEGMEFTRVPAHGVVLLAIRKDAEIPAQYLGGNLHISQGMEIKDWRLAEQSLAAEISLPRRWQGEIALKIRSKPVEVSLDDGKLEKWSWKDGLLRVILSGRNSAFLQVKW